MAQASGAADVGVYCVPQAVQMNASMIIRSLLEDRADMLSKCVRYLQAIVLVWLIGVNAGPQDPPQIKAAPTRRLTRRWPFCCQVDLPRTVTPRGALRSMQRYRLHLGF